MMNVTDPLPQFRRRRLSATLALAATLGTSALGCGDGGNPGPNGDAGTPNPSVVLSSSVTMLEEGGSGSLTVVLGGAPDADVAVVLTSSVPSRATLGAGGGTPSASVTVTFGVDDWNEPQTITVTAVDDQIANGSQSVVVSTAIGATTDTSGYATLTSLPSHTLTVIDDDAVGVAVGPTALAFSENGGSGVFSVVLSSAPDGVVAVTLASGGGRALLSDSTNPTPAASLVLTFDASNWNVAHEVTATGVDDAVAAESLEVVVAVSIDAGGTTDGTGYASLAASSIDDVTLTVGDDEIVYVDQSAIAGTQDGTSWANAFLTVQAGLAAASADGAVWVAEGVYAPSASATNVAFGLRNDVAFYGGFVGDETSVGSRPTPLTATALSGDFAGDDTPGDFTVNRGDNASIVVGAATTRMDGFIVRGGRDAGLWGQFPELVVANTVFEDNSTSGNGGAVWMSNSPRCELIDVTFRGNEAASGCGGGMFGQFGTYVLTNVTFEGNEAAAGGGLCSGTVATWELDGVVFLRNVATGGGGAFASAQAASATITNSRFEANRATQGAGIEAVGGTWKLDDVRLIGNAALGSGGGMNMGPGASTTLTNVLFLYNGVTNGLGGGMRNHGGSGLTATNVLFRDNRARTGGGGLVNTGSSATLTNVTFADNSSSEVAGGAVLNESGASVALRNVAMFGNVAMGGVSDVSNSATVTLTNSCVEQASLESAMDAVVLLVADPFEYAVTGETFLAQSSTCVNAGSDAAANDLVTGFTALGLPSWSAASTSITGAPLDVDATPGDTGGDVDAGRHYDPSRVWINSASWTSTEITWSVYGATHCELTNDANADVIVLEGAELAAGSIPSTRVPPSALLTLTCDDGPRLPVVYSFD